MEKLAEERRIFGRIWKKNVTQTMILLPRHNRYYSVVYWKKINVVQLKVNDIYKTIGNESSYRFRLTRPKDLPT